MLQKLFTIIAAEKLLQNVKQIVSKRPLVFYDFARRLNFSHFSTRIRTNTEIKNAGKLSKLISRKQLTYSPRRDIFRSKNVCFHKMIILKAFQRIFYCFLFE
jgi:hypothetical protein